MNLEWIRFGITAFLMLSGLFIILVSILGVFKFKFDLNRMHAASLTDTLGLLLIILGAIVSSDSVWTIAKLVLIILIMWLSSPVSSHFLSQLEILTATDLKKHMEIEEKKEEKEINGNI